MAPKTRVPQDAPAAANPRDLDLFSILHEDGSLRPGAPDAGLAPERLLELYRAMVLVRQLDQRLLNLQRQGRIAFCGLTSGQEASVIGSGAAIEGADWVFPALRESGVMLLRGWPLSRLFAQMFGNAADVLRGRMQPMHFSDRSVNQVSWGSCIATQLPHAVGAAYAMKLRKDGRVALGYLGDGATSEHDFHAAANFAGVWKVPVVFVCQNNQWAISVPLARQTAAETIAVKARAYGFPGVRVDGNDLLAVYHATREAVLRARTGEGPTLVECVTYRMGGHSSSDDPTRYRQADEVAKWRAGDPVERVRRHLSGRGLWDDAKEAALEEALKAEINQAVKEAEAAGPPPLDSIFGDVTARPAPQLEEQKARLLAEKKK